MYTYNNNEVEWLTHQELNAVQGAAVEGRRNVVGDNCKLLLVTVCWFNDGSPESSGQSAYCSTFTVFPSPVREVEHYSLKYYDSLILNVNFKTARIALTRKEFSDSVNIKLGLWNIFVKFYVLRRWNEIRRVLRPEVIEMRSTVDCWELYKVQLIIKGGSIQASEVECG